MTDEMTVQAQRPSAAPYVLGGAAVGAALGHDKVLGNYGIKKPKYNTWDEILREKSDYLEKQAKKDTPDKGTWEKVKEFAGKLTEAEKVTDESINKAFPEELTNKAKDAVESYKKAVIKVETEKEYFEEAIKNIEKGITDGTVKVEGLTEDASKALKGEELRNKAEEIFKTKDGEYAKRLEDGKKEITQALEQLKTKADEAKVAIPNDLEETIIKARKAGAENINKIKSEAETALKKFAEGLKKGNNKWNMIIGAAVLGILGYLIAPKKSKESV